MKGVLLYTDWHHTDELRNELGLTRTWASLPDFTINQARSFTAHSLADIDQ